MATLGQDNTGQLPFRNARQFRFEPPADFKVQAQFPKASEQELEDAFVAGIVDYPGVVEERFSSKDLFEAAADAQEQESIKQACMVLGKGKFKSQYSVDLLNSDYLREYYQRENLSSAKREILKQACDTLVRAIRKTYFKKNACFTSKDLFEAAREKKAVFTRRDLRGAVDAPTPTQYKENQQSIDLAFKLLGKENFEGSYSVELLEADYRREQSKSENVSSEKQQQLQQARETLVEAIRKFYSKKNAFFRGGVANLQYALQNIQKQKSIFQSIYYQLTTALDKKYHFSSNNHHQFQVMACPPDDKGIQKIILRLPLTVVKTADLNKLNLPPNAQLSVELTVKDGVVSEIIPTFFVNSAALPKDFSMGIEGITVTQVEDINNETCAAAIKQYYAFQEKRLADEKAGFVARGIKYAQKQKDQGRILNDFGNGAFLEPELMTACPAYATLLTNGFELEPSYFETLARNFPAFLELYGLKKGIVKYILHVINTFDFLIEKFEKDPKKRIYLLNAFGVIFDKFLSKIFLKGNPRSVHYFPVAIFYNIYVPVMFRLESEHDLQRPVVDQEALVNEVFNAKSNRRQIHNPIINSILQGNHNKQDLQQFKLLLGSELWQEVISEGTKLTDSKDMPDSSNVKQEEKVSFVGRFDPAVLCSYDPNAANLERGYVINLLALLSEHNLWETPEFKGLLDKIWAYQDGCVAVLKDLLAEQPCDVNSLLAFLDFAARRSSNSEFQKFIGRAALSPAIFLSGESISDEFKGEDYWRTFIRLNQLLLIENEEQADFHIRQNRPGDYKLLLYIFKRYSLPSVSHLFNGFYKKFGKNPSRYNQLLLIEDERQADSCVQQECPEDCMLLVQLLEAENPSLSVLYFLRSFYKQFGKKPDGTDSTSKQMTRLDMVVSNHKDHISALVRAELAIQNKEGGFVRRAAEDALTLKILLDNQSRPGAIAAVRRFYDKEYDRIPGISGDTNFSQATADTVNLPVKTQFSRGQLSYSDPQNKKIVEKMHRDDPIIAVVKCGDSPFPKKPVSDELHALRLVAVNGSNERAQKPIFMRYAQDRYPHLPKRERENFRQVVQSVPGTQFHTEVLAVADGQTPKKPKGMAQAWSEMSTAGKWFCGFCVLLLGAGWLYLRSKGNELIEHQSDSDKLTRRFHAAVNTEVIAPESDSSHLRIGQEIHANKPAEPPAQVSSPKLQLPQSGKHEGISRADTSSTERRGGSDDRHEETMSSIAATRAWITKQKMPPPKPLSRQEILSVVGLAPKAQPVVISGSAPSETKANASSRRGRKTANLIVATAQAGVDAASLAIGKSDRSRTPSPTRPPVNAAMGKDFHHPQAESLMVSGKMGASQLPVLAQGSL